MISRRHNTTPKPPSGDEYLTVMRLLRDGYGVEDIQVRAGIPEAFSRVIVDDIRRDGLFADVYRGAV